MRKWEMQIKRSQAAEADPGQRRAFTLIELIVVIVIIVILAAVALIASAVELWYCVVHDINFLIMMEKYILLI